MVLNYFIILLSVLIYISVYNLAGSRGYWLSAVPSEHTADEYFLHSGWNFKGLGPGL